MPSLFLLLILPVFDLSVTLYFGIAAVDSSSEGFALTQILGFLYHFFSWVILYTFLATFYRLACKINSPVGKRLVQWIPFFVVLPIFGYLLFSWSFLMANGFAPSADALTFLVANLERLPQHILQTSPLIALGLFIGSLSLSLLVLFLFKGSVPFSNRKTAFHQLIFMLLALLACLVSAPNEFLVTPVQAAIAKASRVDSVQIDPGVSATLSIRKPYVPVKLLEEKRFPVIVILIESLRRDLLEMSPSPFPFLESLVKESVFFDRAYATASHSNYADLAFWYSQYPLRKLGLQRYPKDAPWRGDSLFTAFKAHEFATAYISSQNEKWGEMINWLKTDDVDYFYHSEDFEGDTWLNKDDKFGIKMMMDNGVATAGKIEDSATMEVAKRWIQSLDGREDFFLGLNLQNTHFSYVIPEGGAEPFQPSNMDFEAVYFRWPENKKEIVKNRYLNAVYNVDSILQGFVNYLKQKGLWEKSMFVIVGDSGEAFYEHGFGNHSGPMYDEVMRTFAILKLPQSHQIESQSIQKPLSHIDIASALLDVLDMPLPDSFQGVSPFDPEHKKPVFMHTNAIIKQNAVVEWPWKLLHTHYPTEGLELYNLENDAAERKNLAVQQKEVAARLDEVLSSWVARQVLYYSNPDFYMKMAPPKSIN